MSPKPKKKKRKVKPVSERKLMGDCEVGDVIRDSDGYVAEVTAWLAGGPFGRYRDGDGNEGEFVALDPAKPIAIVPPGQSPGEEGFKP